MVFSGADLSAIFAAADANDQTLTKDISPPSCRPTGARELHTGHLAHRCVCEAAPRAASPALCLCWPIGVFRPAESLVLSSVIVLASAGRHVRPPRGLPWLWVCSACSWLHCFRKVVNVCVCIPRCLWTNRLKSPLPLILVHLLCLCHSMCGRSALWSAYVAAMWVGRSTRACLASVCAQGHSRCLRRAATVLYRIVSIIALNAKAMSLFPWGDQVRHFHVPISAPCGSAARSEPMRQRAP